MTGKRYDVDTRHQGSPPRRPPPSRARDFTPPRRRQYAPYQHRGTGQYSRWEADESRRIEKRNHYDRDFNLRSPRFSEYDRGRERDGDGGTHVAGARRSRSPRWMEKRDDFDRDVGVRSGRLSDYADGGKDKGRDEVGVGQSRRSCDEDLYHRDARSAKFLSDHTLDGSRKSDHFSVRDYSHARDYRGVGDTSLTRVGGERDYKSNSRYSGSDQAGFLSRSQYLDSTKPLSLEHDRGEMAPSHSYSLACVGVDDISVSSLGRGDYVASRYLSTGTDKQGYFHFRDEPHMEKRDGAFHGREDFNLEKKSGDFHFQEGPLDKERPVGREMYKSKQKDDLLFSRGYLKGDYGYRISASQPKDCVSMSSRKEGFPGYSASKDIHVGSPMIQTGSGSWSGSGVTAEPIDFAGYGEKQNFTRRLGVQLDDTRRSSRLYRGLSEEKRGGQYFEEFGRKKIDSLSTRPRDIINKYEDQHMSRIDDSSHRKHMMDDGPGGRYPFSGYRSTPENFDAFGSPHTRKKDLDFFATQSSHLNYGIEDSRRYERFTPKEHHPDLDRLLWSHDERSDILKSREYDPSLYDSPRKRLAFADSSLAESSMRRLEQKHVGDKLFYGRGDRITISTDEYGARKIYNQVGQGDEIDPVSYSKKPESHKFNYEKTWREPNEMVNYQPSTSIFSRSHLGKTRKSDSRDIKKRLGPVTRKLHVSQRLVKKYKPSIKKRLIPAPPKKRATLPWPNLKNPSSNRLARVQNNSDGGPRADGDGDQLGNHLLAKPEPPEYSDDFKQLVQSSFFKFLKQINETPTKRKKYMEQGKAGSLKCIVCVSDSEEFADTETLAMHAFTSKKNGLRSQHLGLHRALCVLRGWKITENPSSEWHCEAISDAEISVLREDLIIWPPVVIVHNSTIDNNNAEERVIVSIEKLDMKLRDMGFRSILKVCNGKPANQSVMVVKFNGTLTGLQEAERYHKSYLESNHGRAELEQLRSTKDGSSSRETRSLTEEEILYGHMGIAEDLVKLDFDTKKRCVLRSRKGIHGIVDTPIGTE